MKSNVNRAVPTGVGGDARMSFFSDFFNLAPCPPAKREEVNRLISELITIGQKEDYLSERPGRPFNAQCRHEGARQIGRRLDEIGGLELMEFAHRQVKRKAGKNLAAHLEYAWADIGRWLP